MDDRPHVAARPSAAVAALLVLALMLRVGFVLSRDADEAAMFKSLPDQREYLHLGRHLLSHASLQFYDDRFDQTVRAYRTAGYPMLVAAGGGNVRAIRLVQALLDTSSVLAIYLLGRRWLGNAGGLAAGAMVAFSPFLVFFTSLILSETLFVAMLCWAMVLLSHRATRLFWGGVGLLALSAYVRPSGAGLAVCLAAGGMWLHGATWRQGLIAAVAAAGITVLALLPWAIRNRLVVGSYVWGATNAGATLYDGFNPAADGSSDQSFLSQMPELRAMGEVQRSAHLGALARAWIRENPRNSVVLAARKLARTWSPIPLSDEYGGRRAYVVAAAGYAVPLFLLAVAGLARGGLSGRQKLFLVLPGLYLSVVHALSVGSLRYRIPAEPPLAVLAAAGLFRPRQDAPG